MNTTRRTSLVANWIQNTIAAGLIALLAGCGGTLSKNLNAGNGSGNGSGSGSGSSGSNDPLLPESMVNGLSSFKPTTRGVAAQAQGYNDPTLGFGANAVVGYPGLGDILAGSLFMKPASQGLAIDLQWMMGSFTVNNGELVPAFGQPFLAHLGRSNEHVYIGGELDVSYPGSMAEFFTRHHDPNRTRHCLASCQLKNENGQIVGRITSDLSGTTTTLGTVYLMSPRAAVECVAYKDTLAMYINGKLAIAAKDPQPVARQALFGISALNGRFRSLSAANLDTLSQTNQITFYENEFTYPSGAMLPIQWEVTGGGALIGNNEVVPYGGTQAVAQLRQVDVADSDLSMDFKLSYNNPTAALVARSNATGNYRAEVALGAGGYTVAIYRSNQTAPISGPFTIPAKPTGTLRFTLHREELRAYVDNQLYAAAADSTAGFAKGRVGMILKDATGDNFKWKSFY